MVDTVYPVNAVAGAPAYSGRMLRQAGAVALAGATAARPLGARSGVRPGTSTTTVTATSTTWTCGPFAGVIDGEAAAEAGPYTFAFDAAATGSVTAANASNPRIDIIYVQVDDPSESDGTSAPVVRRGYLTGTAAASPVAPAAPARSFVVAQINVPKAGGGAPTVTWVAPYAVAAGGLGYVNTLSQLPASGVRGERIQALDTGISYRFDGAAWKPWESEWFSATPLVTAQSGSFVSVTAALRWKYSAGAVVYLLSVTVGSAGTASGNVTVAMPFTAAFAAAAAGMNQSTGGSIWGVMFSGENVLRINTYNNAGATGTGNILQVSGTVLI